MEQPDTLYPGQNQSQQLRLEHNSVCFTQLYGLKDGQIVQFNVTCRADSGKESIDQMIETIRYAGERYGLKTVKPDVSIAAPTHAPVPAAQPAAPAPAVPEPAAPASPVPATGVNPSASGNVVHAVKMSVTPMPEGKVKLEWFAAGHQYADIYTTRTIESAIELLAMTGKWNPENLAHVSSYNVKYKITWMDGKLNSKNRPYKDITDIVPE